MTATLKSARNGQWEASMSQEQDNKMNGVVEGAYRLNVDRLQVLNERIFERNIPSTVLQQQFSQRPVSTKYSILPLFDTYKDTNVPIVTQQTYRQEQVFNPGTSAPFNGYVNAINDESRLRNQFFALQKCEQSVYVPSSQSDLYSVTVPQKRSLQDSDGLQDDNRSLLFKEEELGSFNPNVFRLGGNLFENHTRQQLKGISDNGVKQSANIRLGNNTWK
jgi:hypothetical protein